MVQVHQNPIRFIFWLSCITVFILLEGCQPGAKSDFFKFQGDTMGTTYHIAYIDVNEINYQQQIDSVLVVINQSLSTYIENSTISLVNNFNIEDSTSPDLKLDLHFLHVYEAAKAIYYHTEGAFDPTVMPLVNYWGFGYTDRDQIERIDSAVVDSLLSLVNFEGIRIKGFGEDPNKGTIIKSDPRIRLDFSAIAKGYGVDEVGRFLIQNKVYDFFIEIGGEVLVHGNPPNKRFWSIAIQYPDEKAPINEANFDTLNLYNVAMATSGNYRNFNIINGQKVAHTINPKTGYPEISNLLSVSVIANNCMDADAYATAFMVMGLEKAMEMAKTNDGLEAYFIYADSSGEAISVYTKGIEKMLSD